MSAIIWLITGSTGAGKTARAVHECLKAVAEGKAVYQINCAGFQAAGVSELKDWRDAPDGAVVLIDEAQSIWRNPTSVRGYSKERRAKFLADCTEMLHEMEVHRHRGIQLILTTQHPRLIHPDILPLLGRHEHLRRQFGSAFVNLWWADHAMSLTSAELKMANRQQWRHPKHVFQAYKSASVHEKNKIKIPGKVLAFLAVIGLWGGWIGWKMLSGTNPFVPVAKAAAVQHAPVALRKGGSPLTTVAEVKTQGRQPVVYGCISSDSACLCYDQSGQPMDLADKDCREMVEKPIRRSIRTGFSGGSVL